MHILRYCGIVMVEYQQVVCNDTSTEDRSDSAIYSQTV